MVKYWTGSLALDFRIPRLVMGLANQACTARVGPRWNIGLTSKLAFWLLEMLLVGPSFSVCSRWCKLWDTPLTVFPDLSGKMGESSTFPIGMRVRLIGCFYTSIRRSIHRSIQPHMPCFSLKHALYSACFLHTYTAPIRYDSELGHRPTWM